ncbi:partial Inner membrane protein YjdF, partial [Anaerolineales bacterium]
MNCAGKNRYYLLTLGAIFLVLWALLAIAPYDRKDWALENVLVFLIVPFLVLTRKRLPLSRVSYTSIFIFLCLHEVGAHYTYAKVPYDEWFRSLTGTPLNELLGFQRNHF